MIRKSFPGVLVLVLCIFTLKAQEVQNIFADVNSEYDEQNPVLSPDGQTLYFTRSNHPRNVGGRRDTGDIWYSTLTTNMRWSAPENAEILNNKGWNGVIGFSKDGSTVYLHNHYKEENGMVKSQGIARSVRNRNRWSSPEDIDIPYYKNLSRNAGGSVSRDGKVIVLSIESYGSKGGEDIYVSFQQSNGQWTEPKNLGSTINSPYQEFSPFLSDDLQRLYFSSNGRSGKGSSDIFVADRLDNGWTNWSTPRQLENVNTRGREKDYRKYNNFAIYSSTLNSDGYSDLKIYTEKPLDSLLQKIAPPIAADTATDVPDEKEIPEVLPNAIILYGEIRDAKDNSYIDAIVSVADEDFKKETTTEVDNGRYTLNIPDSGLYGVQVDAPGYISVHQSVNISNRENNLLELNYTLQPIAVGTTVNLKSVLFQQSTANIMESSYKELDLVVDVMKQNPSMKIRLEGHTDNRGVAKHNKRLSKKRAEAVKAYLVENGVSKRRITERGYGGSKPIADNDDPEQRKLNRRVEFTIIRE